VCVYLCCPFRLEDAGGRGEEKGMEGKRRGKKEEKRRGRGERERRKEKIKGRKIKKRRRLKGSKW
jgi:hypothetical protein